MQEAAQRLKAIPASELGPQSWVIAWVEGDAAIQAAIAAQHKKVQAELIAAIRGP